MEKKKAIVVIPVYKSKLNKIEELSLIQCLEIFRSCNICLVHPEGLELSGYTKHSKRIFKEEFNLFFFKDIEGYNKLLTSEEFYSRFLSFEYMLIYQLDAWVFRNELNYWCNKGYDYIGAPIFEDSVDAGANSKIIGVGNGGLSLRNIKSSLKILRRVRFINNINRLITQVLRIKSHTGFILLLHIFSKKMNFKNIKQAGKVLKCFKNEDIYWSMRVPEVFDDFNVAPVDQAIKFSFEANPSKLFDINNNKLPFGCHAFQRYEPSFWKNYINF